MASQQHNPFLVDDDDSDSSHEGADDRQLLRSVAGANQSSDDAHEMFYSNPASATATSPESNKNTNSKATSSVFSKQRAHVPELPNATNVSVGVRQEAGASNARNGARGGFWIFSFAYYQKYFDVDTADVMRRIRKATYGALGGELFLEDVKDRADLYGAFWGCATLVFVVAMGGNFADYLEREVYSMSSSSNGRRMMMRKLLVLDGEFSSEEDDSSNDGSMPSPPPPAPLPHLPPPLPAPAEVREQQQPWQFDVTKVSQCAAMTYAYVFLFPLSLYLVKRCYAGVSSASYTALVCLYGYSIISYIPASIVCILPVETVRWIAVSIACAVSSASLFRNVDALLKGEAEGTKARAIAKGMGVAIVGANAIFAIALKSLFFRF
jgi:hypothetical protein